MKTLFLFATLFSFNSWALETVPMTSPDAHRRIVIIGNGGDAEVLQFMEAARFARSRVHDQKILDAKELAKLDRALDETEVEATDDLMVLNGVQKTFVNIPHENRIIFNRHYWIKNANVWYRAALAFHEFLGVAGIEDRNYEVTIALVLKSWMYSGVDAITLRELLGIRPYASTIECVRHTAEFWNDYSCRIDRLDAATKRLTGRYARELWGFVSGGAPVCTQPKCYARVKDVGCWSSVGEMSDFCSGEVLTTLTKIHH